MEQFEEVRAEQALVNDEETAFCKCGHVIHENETMCDSCADLTESQRQLYYMTIDDEMAQEEEWFEWPQ